MTRDTEALIAALAAHARPVRRLPPPSRRVLAYLGFAALLLAALAVARGPRGDLAERLADPAFLAALAAGLATGIAGALAALMLAAPDRSRGWIALPLATTAAWLAAIGLGCLGNWAPLQPGGIEAAELANCFATVALTGTPLTLAMAVLLRRAAPLRPGLPLLSAGLAAAGLASVALSVLHGVSASVMILAWTALVLALCLGASAAAARLLRPA
jgi:hypothetical protein